MNDVALPAWFNKLVRITVALLLFLMATTKHSLALFLEFDRIPQIPLAD